MLLRFLDDYRRGGTDMTLKSFSVIQVGKCYAQAWSYASGNQEPQV